MRKKIVMLLGVMVVSFTMIVVVAVLNPHAEISYACVMRNNQASIEKLTNTEHNFIQENPKQNIVDKNREAKNPDQKICD
jgi:lipopolysaccharide export LptBFGC system permease protein LptF